MASRRKTKVYMLERSGGYELIKTSTSGKIIENKTYLFKSSKEMLKHLKLMQQEKISEGLKNFLTNSKLLGDKFIVQTENMKREIRKIAPSLKVEVLVNKTAIKKIINVLDKTKKCSEKNVDREKSRLISHLYYSFKVFFDSKKIDGSIVYCLKLLDQLEKTISSYSNKLIEWYSYHFPELDEILLDKIKYAKVIQRIKKKSYLKFKKLSDIVETKIEEKIREASLFSIGKELDDSEIECIIPLANQVIKYDNLKSQIYKFLENKMYIIAPNISALIGEKIGARIISHAGSMISLCKYPASTIQMFGAEKALFRALKTGSPTPKYGHIFNAKIISGANRESAGKLSRILSAKTSLCARIDTLGEKKFGGSLGIKYYFEIENKVKQINKL